MRATIARLARVHGHCAPDAAPAPCGARKHTHTLRTRSRGAFQAFLKRLTASSERRGPAPPALGVGGGYNSPQPGQPRRGRQQHVNTEKLSKTTQQTPTPSHERKPQMKLNSRDAIDELSSCDLYPFCRSRSDGRIHRTPSRVVTGAAPHRDACAAILRAHGRDLHRGPGVLSLRLG